MILIQPHYNDKEGGIPIEYNVGTGNILVCLPSTKGELDSRTAIVSESPEAYQILAALEIIQTEVTSIDIIDTGETDLSLLLNRVMAHTLNQIEIVPPFTVLGPEDFLT